MPMLSFNSRTHMGCDCNTHSRSTGRHVSIHAPIWGATEIRRSGQTARERVSIHAPIWGATWRKYTVILLFCFNSRTHMGCDSCCIDVYYTSICQPYFAKLSN